MACICDDPTCSKCLLVTCKDENCPVHTPELKERRRNAKKWYIVPQTEAQIEANRKRIEEMRAKGLLDGIAKAFKINEDGTVMQID